MVDLTEQITREYEREHQDWRLAVALEDIPLSYEAISPRWLTNVLCQHAPGAEVVDIGLDEPDDGNTNRRRIFLHYNKAGLDAGLPSAVFCKALHNLPNRLVDANCRLIQGEDAFYNEYQQFLDIEMPSCFFGNYSRQSYNSILVLEDLTLRGVEFCTHESGVTRSLAQSQMSLLAQLHGRFWESSELHATELPNFAECVEFVDGWFDLKACCTRGFEMAREVIPPGLYKRGAEVWPSTLQAFDLHRTKANTFTHNDTHLRNWYSTADGQMGLSDWQCFAPGHWGRDVAYTIATCLEIDDRRAWERDLLEFYTKELAAAGGPILGFDEAWTAYRQHLFDALAWWTLTLAPSSGQSELPPPDFQPPQAALTFIGRTATAIDDLDALGSFEGI